MLMSMLDIVLSAWFTIHMDLDCYWSYSDGLPTILQFCQIFYMFLQNSKVFSSLFMVCKAFFTLFVS